MTETAAPAPLTLSDIRQRMQGARGKDKRSVIVDVSEWIPGLKFGFNEPGPIETFQAAEIAAEMRIEYAALPQRLCNQIALLAVCCCAPPMGSEKDRIPFFVELADAEQARKEGFDGMHSHICSAFNTAFPKSRGTTIEAEADEAKNG